MDGVLEATIFLCGYKVLCSVLYLPVFKDSISSVSLCCSCLLLFTDLSITVFLAYLWCSAPRPAFFHPSSDVIALHFMLFLSNTYWLVLMLTPLLVAVEVLVRYLWPQEATGTSNTSGVCKKPNKESEVASTVLLMDGDGEACEREPLQKIEEGKDRVVFLKCLKAVGFLGSLLLWGMSGTYAESSWRQDQHMVSDCLDRGGSLSACLPCLLTISSPIRGQLSWVLGIVLLLLGLTGSLGLLLAKLSQLPLLIFQTNQLQSSRERGAASSLHLRTLCKWVKLQSGSESRKAERNSGALLQTQTFEGTPDHNSCVDSKKKADSCSAQTPQCGHNERRCPCGSPMSLSVQTGSAGSCKIQSKGTLLVSLLSTELPLEGIEVENSRGQALHPHERQLWKPLRESPCLRGDLMTGLLCGLLVCVFPTVLSTNVLLVSNLDTLAAYAVKHLLIPSYCK
ncbi:uncharacterized protein [Hoplias malabaricus]|uniref:uncharacterized protein n=1 Tax=Hoplias malabaricus TaxID=27720 RepID=UPI0034622D71